MIRKLLLSLVAVMSGCMVFTMPYGIPLDAEDTPPADKVLLIGQFVLDPPVEQGPLAVHAPRGTHKGVIKLDMTYDLRGSIDLTKPFGNPVDEGMDVKFSGLSVVPLAPGDHYVRAGTVMIQSRVSGGGYAPGMNKAAVGVEASYIPLIRDIKIDLPAGSKAVYVGKITFKHDGQKCTGVIVSDDFQKAMQDLAKLKIAGVKPSDVKKKLAVVISKQAKK